MEHLLGLPPDASAQGPSLDQLTVLIHWLMFALFLGWGTYYIVMLIRFRAGANPKASYFGTRTKLSTYIEAIVAIIEITLLVVFAIPLWGRRVNSLPDEKSATVIHVIAEQYAWNIHYAGPDGKFGKSSPKLVSPENPIGLDRDDADAKDDIVTNNQMWLPVNKPVIIYLTTKDVIHSFSIPYMRVKQDAIPGEQIPLWFTPTKTSEEMREEVTTVSEIGMSIPVARASGMTSAGTYNGNDGKPILSMSETITDTIISQLQSAGIKKIDVLHDMSTKVSMDEYRDAQGNIILRKKDAISDSAEFALLKAGIKTIKVAPDVPMEIACAQLCGLGHFRMRGYLTVVPESQFNDWLKLQESYVNPDAAAAMDSASTHQQIVSDTVHAQQR